MSYRKNLHEAVDRLEELIFDCSREYPDAENEVAELFSVRAEDVRAEYDRRAEILI